MIQTEKQNKSPSSSKWMENRVSRYTVIYRRYKKGMTYHHHIIMTKRNISNTEQQILLKVFSDSFEIERKFTYIKPDSNITRDILLSISNKQK